jgi:hypothetical protein
MIHVIITLRIVRQNRNGLMTSGSMQYSRDYRIRIVEIDENVKEMLKKLQYIKIHSIF